MCARGTGNPFDLDDEPSYRRWRAWKFEQKVGGADALVVDLADPAALSAAEQAALRQRIARHGVAIYRSRQRAADPALPRALGAQLGLMRLHANWLADEEGISHLQLSREREASAPRADYIPYTDRALGWHTDGYYHRDDERILGLILHCVRPAAAGGENAWLDPELAYITLRDESPAWARALMHPQAMTIPAREDGEGTVARAAHAGPVFSLAAGGRLHMRYTARTRSIAWRDDAATAAAVRCLRDLMDHGDAAAGILRFRLEAGMGIVGHNGLHARTAFTDDPAAPRLVYRARYMDRVEAPEEDAWRTG